MLSSCWIKLSSESFNSSSYLLKITIKFNEKINIFSDMQGHSCILFQFCYFLKLSFHWFITYKFHCIMLYFNFCIHHSVLTTKDLVSAHHHKIDPLYQFCPTHPLPLLYPLLCFLYPCVCFLFLVCSFCFYIPLMSEIIWYLSFSTWLISLRIFSRSIHVDIGFPGDSVVKNTPANQCKRHGFDP